VRLLSGALQWGCSGRTEYQKIVKSVSQSLEFIKSKPKQCSNVRAIASISHIGRTIAMHILPQTIHLGNDLHIVNTKQYNGIYYLALTPAPLDSGIRKDIQSRR